MSKTLQMVCWPLMALLLLVPLPLGSNRPIPWTVLALVVGLLLLAWVGTAHLRSTRCVMPLEQLLPAVSGFALVLLVVVLQVVPWTPRSWHHPIWVEASGPLGAGVQGRISVDPYQTGTAAMRVLTYAGVFWLALQLSRSPKCAAQIVRILILAGLAYALYGLAVYLFDLGTILWWKRWHGSAALSSSFVNSNSYATYAGLGLLCAVAWLITTTYRELARAGRRRVPWRLRLVRLTWRQWWVVAAVIILAFALILTGSRAGVASSAVGLVVLIGCFGATRLMRRRDVVITGGLALSVAVVVFALGGDDLADQFDQQGLRSPRFEAYQRIGRAIGDNPWLGTGYGTFAEVYRGYQVGATREYWNHGHDTYLENALELGILPAAALTGAIGWLAVRCGGALQRRRRNALYPCLGVAATTLVGLHALLDFSLEIPAVAVTYAAILGVAFGRARRRSERDLDHAATVWRSRPQRRALGLAAVAGTCLLVLAVPRLLADLTAVPLTLVHRQLEAQAMPSISALDRAIAAGRAAAAWANAGDNWWRVGLAELALAQQPELAANARLARLERAELALRLSLAAAPVNPTAWTQLAYVALVRSDYALVSDALALSVQTGPSLGPLMPLRSGVAALAWDGLHPSARALFEIQFVNTMRFAPRQFVQAIRGDHGATEVVNGQLEREPALRAKFERLLLILGRG